MRVRRALTAKTPQTRIYRPATTPSARPTLPPSRYLTPSPLSHWGRPCLKLEIYTVMAKNSSRVSAPRRGRAATALAINRKRAPTTFLWQRQAQHGSIRGGSETALPGGTPHTARSLVRGAAQNPTQPALTNTTRAHRHRLCVYLIY